MDHIRQDQNQYRGLPPAIPIYTGYEIVLYYSNFINLTLSNIALLISPSTLVFHSSKAILILLLPFLRFIFVEFDHPQSDHSSFSFNLKI